VKSVREEWNGAKIETVSIREHLTVSVSLGSSSSSWHCRGPVCSHCIADPKALGILLSNRDSKSLERSLGNEMK
jgi:hypothetical protein